MTLVKLCFSVVCVYANVFNLKDFMNVSGHLHACLFDFSEMCSIIDFSEMLSLNDSREMCS